MAASQFSTVISFQGHSQGPFCFGPLAVPKQVPSSRCHTNLNIAAVVKPADVCSSAVMGTPCENKVDKLLTFISQHFLKIAVFPDFPLRIFCSTNLDGPHDGNSNRELAAKTRQLRYLRARLREHR